MTTTEHCHLWADFWAAEADTARAEHNTDRMLAAMRQRRLAERCRATAAEASS